MNVGVLHRLEFRCHKCCPIHWRPKEFFICISDWLYPSTLVEIEIDTLHPKFQNSLRNQHRGYIYPLIQKSDSKVPFLFFSAIQVHRHQAPSIRRWRDAFFSSMNIFRFFGDLSHLVSILILIYNMRERRSSSGLSFKSQCLYTAVFVTRYLGKNPTGNENGVWLE